jgi:hypothetical protein
MKKIIVSVFSIVLSTSFGQMAGNAIYDNVNSQKNAAQKVNAIINYDNSVQLEADIMLNLSPSSYTAIFSVTQQGRTASETDSLMVIRMKNIENQLEKAGVAIANIKEDMIAMIPTYSYQLEEKKISKTYNEVPIGFLMKKNIHVLFFEHEKFVDIVSVMSKNEVYDLVKVDYNLADLNTYLKQIRAAAQQIIKEKEKDYETMGIKLDILSIADAYNVVSPLERYANYTAYYNGSTIEEITTAKKKKELAKGSRTASVSSKIIEDDTEFIIKTSEKSKTVFYNKMPYTDYDLVINADHAEPRIQIIYQLKSKYTSQNKSKFDESVSKQKTQDEEIKEKRKK